MTLRNCILMQSHLDTLIHVARDDPSFQGFLPALEKLADRTLSIKQQTSDTCLSNVIRANFIGELKKSRV